jgi:hypothetical protein
MSRARPTRIAVHGARAGPLDPNQHRFPAPPRNLADGAPLGRGKKGTVAGVASVPGPVVNVRLHENLR